jgi:hypothetical protein
MQGLCRLAYTIGGLRLWMRQRILATRVFVAGSARPAVFDGPGVTTRLSSPKSDPGYNFRERMRESVGAPAALDRGLVYGYLDISGLTIANLADFVGLNRPASHCPAPP